MAMGKNMSLFFFLSNMRESCNFESICSLRKCTEVCEARSAKFRVSLKEMDNFGSVQDICHRNVFFLSFNVCWWE